MSESRGHGPWVLTTWHYCHWNLIVHFLLRKDGKPAMHYGDTASPADAFGWHSYHAAKKFQRENPCLRGYVIMNLDEVREQHQLQQQIDDAQTQEELEELRRRFGEKY